MILYFCDICGKRKEKKDLNDNFAADWGHFDSETTVCEICHPGYRAKLKELEEKREDEIIKVREKYEGYMRDLTSVSIKLKI